LGYCGVVAYNRCYLDTFRSVENSAMTNDLIKKIKQARKVSIPIIGITSADQIALSAQIRDICNGNTGLIQHDVIRGAVALNDKGTAALSAMLPPEVDPAMATQNPMEFLNLCRSLPESNVVICHNVHRWIDQPGASQAIANLRNLFKQDFRTLVLLAPELQLPIESNNDVILFDESLPDRPQLKKIVSSLHNDAALPECSPEALEAASEALVGLSSFGAEQSAALALTKEGIDIEECWTRKRKMVEQTKGLSMPNTKLSFDSIGGLDSAKEFFGKLFRGPMAPRLILRIEEIEKLMSGTGASGGPGDSSGVSQDQLQVLLDRIESNRWLGALFIGPGGSGKSYFSEALAGEFGIRSITLDTGAMKGSLVGSSEAAIRSAMRTIEAIGQDRVLICATCNGLQELRPELQRRLASAGIWFFDLPTAEEKQVIWQLQAKAFGLQDNLTVTPSDEGWSSSDIRDCCRQAYLLNESLIESGERINPAMAREAQRITNLRNLAAGKMRSATYKGSYRLPQAKTETNQRRALEV
jgi:hypothetical protein